MNAQDLRNLLENEYDKLSIFASAETFNKYNFNAQEFFDLINDFLSDEEKLKLFDYSHFQEFEPWIKFEIVELVSNQNIKLQIFNNDNIISSFQTYQIVKLIKELNDSGKKQILSNQAFIEKYQITTYELKDIILSLSDDVRTEILTDSNFITDKLHLENFEIADLIKSLSSEKTKSKILERYQLDEYLMSSIVNTFSNTQKAEILLKENNFSKYSRIQILASFNIETLSSFLVNNKEFCDKNDIHPYEVVMALNSKEQKDFVSKLTSIDLTLAEKREILATLKEETKQNIDTTNLPKEYKTAISITTEYSDKIILDLDRDLEDYRGLDNLIRINPEQFTEEQKAKFMQLCDICPNSQVVSVLDNMAQYTSNASEYKEAEEWILSIIDNLNPKYSKAQKMAIIDNEIGKKISYSPDFDTEVFNRKDCRALWKIISSGYGVCNGISKVEQYIFNKVGIESDIISSGNHSFLKIKDIELPLSNGEIAKGNTILDPTWNLTSHRFGGRPNFFCISYENARKSDIDINGNDSNCHKNDGELQDASLNLDDQSLRKLFTSVGLADRDGQFPIKDLFEKSKLLDELYANQPDQNINEQFLLLSQVCPEFARCQNSSMTILNDILLNNEHLKFNDCVINRVYDKTDKGKRPVLFVYIDSNELGKRFYFADKNEGQFVELSQEDFMKQFECYEKDLKKYNRT